MMKPFAVYRFPDEKSYHVVSLPVAPRILASMAEINESEGFVIAPFAPSDDSPILLLGSKKAEGGDFSMNDEEGLSLLPDESDTTDFKSRVTEEREAYRQDFLRFQQELGNGMFGKLVLARSFVEMKTGRLSPREIFVRACHCYPHQYIALFYTPQTGMWLMASPEILLEGRQGRYRTMALAGTMPYREGSLDWSEKNREEQKWVADYVRERLQPIADRIEEQGPYTVQAAGLAHLRTDFRFCLNDNIHLGHFLDTFHPTPAVCGMPKEAARKFILAHEHTRRRYYSGFTGPVSKDGSCRLYVTLRCMQMGRCSYRLFAGGGLLKESTEDNEWKETEAKLQTMRRLLL
ncbi:isochorismate synthase [Prevotella dentasini JCM 15908]